MKRSRRPHMDTDYHMGIRGVLTVEAAMVLPVFLFGVLSLISLFSFLRFYIAMDAALNEEALYIAQESAIIWNRDIAGVTDDIRHIIGMDYAGSIPVDGGYEGIDYSSSDFDNRELVILNAAYQVSLPFDPWGLYKPSVVQRVVSHTWIGYINGLDGMNMPLSEDYVYVTETGSVYHRDLNCPHLRLNIREINPEDIDEARNANGHKYYKCEHCHANKNSAHIYVTDDGDRFHDSLSCSGLKRTIRSVRLTEINGYAPCKTCGY